MSTGSYVYFIQAGDDGPIKIGVSTDPIARLGHLQVANPVKLRLLGVIVGDAIAEKNFHFRFLEHRLSGEWFSPNPRVLVEVYQAIAGGLLALADAGSLPTESAIVVAGKLAQLAEAHPEEFRRPIKPTPDDQEYARAVLAEQNAHPRLACAGGRERAG